jgi:hypothetical protein
MVGTFDHGRCAFITRIASQAWNGVRARNGPAQQHPAPWAKRLKHSVLADDHWQFLDNRHSSKPVSNDRLKFKRLFKTTAARKQGFCVISTALCLGAGTG